MSVVIVKTIARFDFTARRMLPAVENGIIGKSTTRQMCCISRSRAFFLHDNRKINEWIHLVMSVTPDFYDHLL